MKQNALRTALKITRSTPLVSTYLSMPMLKINPNWNELGAYFDPLISIDSEQSENWSKQRYERLKKPFCQYTKSFSSK